ncbi:hypothetical protein I3760_Q016000 [Carya illinoinensis]|nr:hypothetical protein I3760_Q016000 [Carya illinoinensis]
MLVISNIYKVVLSVRKREDNFETIDEMGNVESLQFDFDVIRAATSDFSAANKIGKGGFGPVYKAWKNLREGTVVNLIDLTLRRGPLSEMIRCIHIGLLCVQANVADRLDMASVVSKLNAIPLLSLCPNNHETLCNMRFH